MLGCCCIKNKILLHHLSGKVPGNNVIFIFIMIMIIITIRNTIIIIIITIIISILLYWDQPSL